MSQIPGARRQIRYWRIVMTSRDIWTLGKSAVDKWNEHNAPSLSAALAYYALLSLAPVVILIVLISGLLFARESAEQHLLDQVRDLAGNEWVAVLRTLIENAQKSKAGLLASVVATGTLIFGSSTVFAELRDSLNTIWEAPVIATCVKDFVHRRIASFATVLVFGVLVLLSTVLDVAFQLIERRFGSLLPMSAALAGQIINLALSFIAITALFGLIFKFVPDVPIAWRDVGIGAVVTAVLFTLGRTLLTFYFTKVTVGSAFGAAGSLVAFVAWIYYSAQIFFFGAILTRVYATRFGSRVSSKTESSV
jgi:membrane protein